MPAALAGLALGALISWATRPRTNPQTRTWATYPKRHIHTPGAN